MREHVREPNASTSDLDEIKPFFDDLIRPVDRRTQVKFAECDYSLRATLPNDFDFFTFGWRVSLHIRRSPHLSTEPGSRHTLTSRVTVYCIFNTHLIHLCGEAHLYSFMATRVDAKMEGRTWMAFGNPFWLLAFVSVRLQKSLVVRCVLQQITWCSFLLLLSLSSFS